MKEKIIKPQTHGDGSVWDIAFSRDPAQKYIFLADGKNERVYVMDRQSLEILTQFGDGGRQPGSGSPCTASRRTRRATSTRPRRTRESAFRNSSTREWRTSSRIRASSGRSGSDQRPNRALCLCRSLRERQFLTWIPGQNSSTAPPRSKRRSFVERLHAAGIDATIRGNDIVGIFGPGFQGATARGVDVLGLHRPSRPRKNFSRTTAGPAMRPAKNIDETGDFDED